jgi:hypothetical protein
LADVVCVMDRGQVLHTGTPDEMFRSGSH